MDLSIFILYSNVIFHTLRMHFRLMSPCLAARAWGLCDGLAFDRCGADEILAELVQYISAHSAGKQWGVVPMYQRFYDTAADDFLQVGFERGERPAISWRMYPVTNTFNECKRLVKIAVRFNDMGAATNDDGAAARIVYMTRCGDPCGFYYIGFFRLVERCACARECVLLLDAMASQIQGLVSAASQHGTDFDTAMYLAGMLARKERDRVRTAAIRRKIRLLDVDEFFWTTRPTSAGP